MAANQTMDLTDLDEAVKAIKKEEIDTFYYTCQNKDHVLGSNMDVMTQVLKGGDGPCLPHGLSIMNTYTEMTTRSKQVAVVVKNLTVTLVTIAKGVNVTQVVAENAVPKVEVAPGTLQNLDEIQGIQ